MELASRIRSLADKYYDEVVRLRREIHSHPELAFEEIKTSTLVAETLKRVGVETKTQVAKTGVLGYIRGGKPGRTIALRADMDALPIKEATGLPFASKNEGKMHACGHDAHTSIALGAAMILNEMKSELNGEVRFLFQPSEERNPGGAPFMIEAGALEGVDEIYGLHVYAQSDAGTVAFYPGEMMASADELYITIKGKSGHGARPHLAVDPIVTTAQLIMTLQTLVSRNLDPFAHGVITIGSIHAGHAPNIIPNEVKLIGTLRSMSKEWREYAHKRIREIVEGVTKANGCEFDLHIDFGYPVLRNWDEQTEFAENAAKEFFGEANVLRAERMMGAEDFAYYLEKVPGTFYRLGIRNEAQGITADIHNDRFTIDEEALRTGIAMQAYLAVKALDRK
ncbi:MAG TPA: amidohydrolase [Candidatus Kapabacteria bacterium]|nr:amidohydrolase [Candidatus Kapabacteria bacterium]